MKKTLFSKAVSLVATLALAVSALPVVSMAEDTAQTDYRVVEDANDWLLNADDSVRDGVKAYIYLERDYTDEQYENEVVAKELTKTELEESVRVYFKDWKKGYEYHAGSGTDEVKGSFNVVHDSTYLLIDLGVERNINKIGFMPYDNGAGAFLKNRIYLSNDINFAGSSTYEVTNGETVFTKGTTTEYDFAPAETKTARYIKVKTIDWYNAGMQYISVKGDEIYRDEDLLHKADGTTLKDDVKITVSHRPYGADDPEAEPKLKDVASITDGKYEIDRTNNGYLDKDKATSYVWEFVNEDKWVVADLGERKAITSIRTLIFPGSTISEKYFRTHAEIQVSNHADFAYYKTLSVLDDSNSADYKAATEAGDNKWFEYSDPNASGEYRYVRILSKNNAFGLTELQVSGYSLCSNTINRTNFDNALMTDESDTSKIRVSNFANAGEHFNYKETKQYAMPVNDKLQITFDGTVDASTVTNDTLVITNKYIQSEQIRSKTVTDCFAVKGDTIYIDPYKFESNNIAKIELKSGIKANGGNIQPQTLIFQTGGIAPLPYVEGKVIKNVAAGKNVFDVDSTTNTISGFHDGANADGVNYFNDNGYSTQEWDERAERRVVIDLGNEYDISAWLVSHTYGIYWNFNSLKLCFTPEGEELFTGVKVDKMPINDMRNNVAKFDTPVPTRYFCIDRADKVKRPVKEVAAFAYVPAENETVIADAYYKRTASSYTFRVEKDGTDESTIIIARYTKGGSLVDVKTTKDNKVTFDNSGKDSEGNAYIIKAFAWDSTTGLKPLTKAVVY